MKIKKVKKVKNKSIAFGHQKHTFWRVKGHLSESKSIAFASAFLSSKLPNSLKSLSTFCEIT